MIGSQRRPSTQWRVWLHLWWLLTFYVRSQPKPELASKFLQPLFITNLSQSNWLHLYRVSSWQINIMLRRDRVNWVVQSTLCWPSRVAFHFSGTDDVRQKTRAIEHKCGLLTEKVRLCYSPLIGVTGLCYKPEGWMLTGMCGVCFCVPLIQFTCEGSPLYRLTTANRSDSYPHWSWRRQRKLSTALYLTIKCVIRIDTGRISQLSLMLFSDTNSGSFQYSQHCCLGSCRKSDHCTTHSQLLRTGCVACVE